MILHSGNHEIIGIRHRETQTLYISHVIEPHSCSNHAYGKIQVGIYIAAIQETIDRARQDKEAKEKSAGDPPADIQQQAQFFDRREIPGANTTNGPTTSLSRWLCGVSDAHMHLVSFSTNLSSLPTCNAPIPHYLVRTSLSMSMAPT